MRDVAGDVGVDAALIYRHFGSKQGLLEACLEGIGDAATRVPSTPSTPEGAIAAIVEEVLGWPDTDRSRQLLLLLSSPDERVAAALGTILTRLAARIAAAIGSPTDASGSSDGLLRAELALAAVVGVIAFRAGGGHTPLASAPRATMEPLVRDLLSVLLPIEARAPGAESASNGEPE